MLLISGLSYILVGVITLSLAYYKPDAYWCKPSIAGLRKQIGNSATTALLQAIGTGCIILGFTLV